MPYTTSLPEPVQWLVRTLGAALIALYMGVLLGLLADLAFGPFPLERLRIVFLAFAAACFVGLLLFQRHRAIRAAGRERMGPAPPPAGASLLLAGILALGFAAFALHMLLAPDTEDRSRPLEMLSMMLAGGTAAVAVGINRIRKRRQWRRKQETPFQR